MQKIGAFQEVEYGEIQFQYGFQKTINK